MNQNSHLKKLVLALVVFAITSLGSVMATKAQGLLISNQTQVTQGGTGFGAVVNILTLQLQGGPGPVEFGSISPPDVETGDAQNTSQCATVAQLTAEGITAGNLAFVFNINQTGGDPLVHLDDWTLNFYSSTGVLLFTASTPGNQEVDYLMVAQGTGGAGYLFLLSGVDAQLAAFFLDPANCIGSSASVSGGVDDGPENFYATRTTAVTAVPEPASMLLLGTGLIGLATGVRRRFRK